MLHTDGAQPLPNRAIFRPGELVDVVADPQALFARPYDPQRWKRFLLATALGVSLGGLLIAPIRIHVAALAGAKPNVPFTLVSTPLSLVLLAALGIALSFVLALALQKPLKTGLPWQATWSFVCEIAFVKLGISTAALGAIVAIRGVNAFFSPHDVARAMPSLAMLFGGAPERLIAVLGIVDPFNVWVCALYFLAFRSVFRASTPYALLAGFAIGLLPQIVVRAIAP